MSRIQQYSGSEGELRLWPASKRTEARLRPNDVKPETVSTHTEFLSRKIIPNLDGLRGCAILLVLFHHAPELSAGNFLRTLQFNGRLGVSLFFTISGFLITTLFLREQDKDGWVNLRFFYLRRILRLFPLYYLVLGVEAAIVTLSDAYSAENRAIFIDKLPSYLFYYSDWHPLATKGPFFVSWSLAVEEQFYLVFGLLFAFVPRWFIAFVCLLLIGTKIIVYNFTVVADLYDQLPWRVLFSYEEPILLGVLVGLALHHNPKSVPWRFSVLTRIGSAIVLLGLLLFLPVTSKTSFTAQVFYLASALLVGGFAISPPSRILNWSILSYIGIVSYGIYLLHMVVYNTVKSTIATQPVIVLLLGVPASIAVAGLSFRFIEQPFLTLKRRFH